MRKDARSARARIRSCPRHKHTATNSLSARRRFPTVRPFAPKGRHAGNPHAHLPTPLHDRQRARAAPGASAHRTRRHGRLARTPAATGRHLPARRRQRHRRAVDRARAGRAAGPARGHREQARRRLDHRRRAGGAGARRRLHAAHVELGAAVDLARADARPRLRRAGQLRSPGLYRRGAHRLRHPSVRARRHVGRADRLDQGPGPAGAVRQRRPGLGRPDRRRTLCARHRRAAAAHSVQGLGRDAQRPAGRTDPFRRGRAAAEPALSALRPAAAAGRHHRAARAAGAGHSRRGRTRPAGAGGREFHRPVRPGGPARRGAPAAARRVDGRAARAGLARETGGPGLRAGRQVPAEFTDFVRRQAQAWEPVVRATGASL